MSESAVIEKRISLSPERAYQLSRLARAKAVSEDKIVEKALDILFSVTDLLDAQTERRGWSLVSENSLRRVWDNDQDAAYDNWQELYGVPAR
jgi:hypothetical protein